MSRKVLSISLPDDLFEEYKKLAEAKGKNQSELFREMVRLYETDQKEKEFYALQQKISRSFRRKDIYTEKEVEQIIFEGR